MKRFTMDEIMQFVSRAREGDRESFGLLYDTYVADVYHFLLSKTRRRDDAQDLTSMTFMKALQHITSFSPKRNTSFRAWLFTIAHRSFLDSTRSGKRHETPLDSTEEPQSSHSPPHVTEHILLSQTLTRALNELTDLQRETIILRVWHDCSFREIAEILGKSEAGVKMHMKRGLVTLQTLVPKEFVAFVALWEWLMVRDCG